MLGDMELKGLVSPVLVVVTDSSGKAALRPDTINALSTFVGKLEQNRHVGVVLGPVASSRAPAIAPSSMEEAMGTAFAREIWISKDRRQLLFRIIPTGTSTLVDLRSLAIEIPYMIDRSGLSIQVGGQAQYYNDFDEAVWRSYPRTIGLALGLSALILLIFFRAPVASAKAILLNLLSVAAGYGMVVLVFQLGHGATLFGQAGGTGAVPMTVPLVIFCILFGLSMDYEIFLLSRIRAAFLATGDNVRSIREGLADTGSVITSAALIMVAVFGAFAFARIVIVQMIGLGLAVAVLVDALVIRSVLGPALMQVAGKWNWWPLTDGSNNSRSTSRRSAA
jgi:RND superfamily putative drug exporter